MNNLISTFTPSALSSFFRSQISSFVPQSEQIENDDREGDKLFTSLTKLGDAVLKDKNELLVFSCKYNGLLSERSSRRKQFEVAKKVLKEDFKDGAIFVFYDEKGKFRFSYIRKNWGEKGEKRYSTWNRFTYFVDPKETNKTFKERVGNCKFTGLDEIQEAFSVEKLTKDFYNDLFKWYQWALSEEIGITFPNNVNVLEDDRLKLEEQIIRLITRLLFVWFIKQKHLIPDLLFDKEKLSAVLKDFDPDSASQGNYYNAILQNLFFATLNKSINERDFAKLQGARDIKTLYRYEEMFSITKEKVLELFKPIPFLNGGLFECLDKEDIDGNKYSLDGFSRNDKKLGDHFKHRAFIPNCLFFNKEKGLIPLLERYNFTVEENAPDEVQVALDPELLGNVFENLLGAFNPETKENARKQSGSFYTPRQIVSYMVDESLIAYLVKELPEITEGVIRELFEMDGLPTSFQDKHDLCEKISNTLRKVKILDPACGSGAYPMGILNRMVDVLQKLDCNNEESVYDRKLHLIEECIYGVDIQTIAAQISKLRFFISLICEQGAMNFEKENYGVITLPNLETKFVAANTLLGIKRKPAQLNVFENPQIDITKRDLLEIRKEHFYAKTANAKKRLREQDAELRNKLSRLLRDNGDFAPEDAIQFSKWNPYDQNSISPFFDPEWMFGLGDGFDIVIGNPPYIQLQNEGGRLAKMFQNSGYKSFARTGDIYSLFYERGWQLLKQGSVLCYITSNKWMRAGYGENIRKFFAENTNPLLLIDFAGQKIFESATVDTNILLFTKAKNEKKTKACVVKEKVLNKLSVFLRHNISERNFTSKESWVISNALEERIKSKIAAVGTPLKDWNISIYRGVLTGYNEAFIIDAKKKEELIADDPKSVEIIRPILRGRDIKKYAYELSDLWLIFIPWHFPLHQDNTITGASKEAEEAFKAQYPAVYNHLFNYKTELSNRNKAETGVRYEWYAMQRWGANYWEDFYKQKIIYPNMTKFLPFYYDKEGFFTNQKCFIITGENIAYLTAFFNSSLFKFCFRDNFPELQGGTRELSKIFFDQIPVLKVSTSVENIFEKLITKIQNLKKIGDDTISLEKELDQRIFNLYNLSIEEQNIIGFIEIQ